MLDVDGYLRRLGLGSAGLGPPSAEGLRTLHRAHVARVPYENLEIQLGRPTTVDPYESADRIVRRHRGGYCYHLNGGFAALLDALGYRVVWHVGGVQGRGQPHPVGANANHLALTVSGLPAEEAPDGWWFADVGLGDALYEPVPLRAGTYRQGPFRYVLGPSEAADGGWRFDHDDSGSFTGMDFAPEPAGPVDFAPRHAWLSTAPESAFVRVAIAQRRDATGVESLKGCVFRRVGDGGTDSREITSAREWYQVLGDLFGLHLTEVDGAERAALWRRVRAAHEEWVLEQAGAL